MSFCNTFRSLVIFLILIPSAQAGVGFSTATFTDQHRDRSLATFFWYPSEDKEIEVIAGNVAFEGFKASQNAKIQDGTFPLYVLVHGTSGNWKNLSWLAAALAKEGAFVMAANHPDYTSGNSSPASVMKMWDQPKDISFLLDRVFSSDFSEYLDKDRINVIGYSLGGYSALALAGAVLDMKSYLSFCLENLDKACEYFSSTFPDFNDSFYENASKNHIDDRIMTSIAIAPGFVESMTDVSLANIDIPVLIIGAEHDKNIPPATHFEPKRRKFSETTEYQEINDASHFSFMQICRPKAIEILAEEGAEFVCKDGGTKSRQEIHKELYQMISKYIQSQKI